MFNTILFLIFIDVFFDTDIITSTIVSYVDRLITTYKKSNDK